MLKAPPGSDLARARQAAHRAFDPLWQSGKMTRTQAYAWLAWELGIPAKDCHMLRMDSSMCHKVFELCTLIDFE